MAALEDAYKRYTESEQGKAIAGMYDAQTNAELSGLKAAYDQNAAEQAAAREKIGTSYAGAANDMQATFERNRRNLNQQAAANGINTGAGSQQQLALQNVYNRDYGALQGQQAQAYADADLAAAKLTAEYQNAIQQAQAQGDYRRMAALLDDYNTQYNRQMQQAQLLAGFGDFSGYAGLYSDEQIAGMRNTWIASNPLLAYNTGAITADQYYAMTGQYAPGQAPVQQSYYRSPDDTPPSKEPETEPEKEKEGSLAAYAAANNIVANSSNAQEASQKLINAGLLDELSQSQAKAILSTMNSGSFNRNTGKAMAYAEQYLRENA